jgi:predicted small lipoprotein YifL
MPPCIRLAAHALAACLAVALAGCSGGGPDERVPAETGAPAVTQKPAEQPTAPATGADSGSATPVASSGGAPVAKLAVLNVTEGMT